MRSDRGPEEFWMEVRNFPSMGGFGDQNQGKSAIFGGYEQSLAKMMEEQDPARKW